MAGQHATLLLVLALAATASFVGAQAPPPGASFGGPSVQPAANVQPPAGTVVKVNWRGVGTQNYTASATSAYVAGGAVANLFLQNATNVVGRHFFVRNADGSTSPAFTREDAAGNNLGIVIGTPQATDPTPATNDNGGYGSIPNVLLKVTSATGFFNGITWITRSNNTGGVVPGNPPLFTLPSSPTGVANFPLCVPYQADYKFWTSGSVAPASG